MERRVLGRPVYAGVCAGLVWKYPGHFRRTRRLRGDILHWCVGQLACGRGGRAAVRPGGRAAGEWAYRQFRKPPLGHVGFVWEYSASRDQTSDGPDQTRTDQTSRRSPKSCLLEGAQAPDKNIRPRSPGALTGPEALMGPSLMGP